MTEPAPEHLADERDDLDWSVERDGRMRDHATVTDDAEPATIPWEG